MKLYRYLLAALLYALPTAAFAQCSGLNPAGSVCANPGAASAFPTPTRTPVLGLPGSVLGSLGLAGNTSGTVTIKPQAAAGTYNFNLPITAGTSGQLLTSGGGGASAMTYTSTGTSGHVLPFLDGANTWSALQTFAPGAVNIGMQVTTTAAAAFVSQTNTGSTWLIGPTTALGATGKGWGLFSNTAGAYRLTFDDDGVGTLGAATISGGTLKLLNSAGTATIIPTATTNFTLPNASGTAAVSASSPLSLNATTGALTCTTCATSSTPSGAALTKVDDTNVTLTLGGSPTTALLNAASLTLGWTGQLGLTRGGTAASLTASNGGIVYSTASALAVLSGTATARQMLQSGASTTPAWSTTTWPATTTINRLLYSSSANVISDLATANSSILVTDSGGIPSLSTTLPAHTLGGTISGGGNQINNVIIGTTTPLAGTFTTLGSGAHTITSASASALTVGLNGATNPAFTVDASTASQAAGFKITGAATGGTVALVATDSGSNTNVTINAKGSGTIGIGSVSTGAVTITPALTLSAALTYGGVTLSNAVTGTGNMVLSAAPTFTTSITSPLVIGGTATSSTLTLESTSGVGATDSILFKSGSQVTRATIASGGKISFGPRSPNTAFVDVNQNAANTAGSIATPLVRFADADGTNTSLELGSYGAATANVIQGTIAGGTLASPTATVSGSGFFSLNGWGYNGSAYAVGAILQLLAKETWGASAQGSGMDFYVTPTGSTTVARRMILNGSGGLGLDTTTDPGAGGIQVNGQQFNPNMASDTATADSTVCTATTGGKLLKGTGALGVCLGTSGRQFKTDLVPMSAGLDELMKVNFQNYRYRKGFGDDGAHLQYGTTAQDVEAAMPDLVRRDVSGAAINFDSGALLFIGLRAIQQLKADNDNLRSELAAIRMQKRAAN